jgi:hypothetical protein
MWYAPTYKTDYNQRMVVHPFPINLIVRWGMDAYYKINSLSRKRKPEHPQYLLGYADGFKSGREYEQNRTDL